MMAAEDGRTPTASASGATCSSSRWCDPQTQAPVADGEVGALVVTPLCTNNITPFLRWLSGDLVMLRDDVPGAGHSRCFR